MSLLSAQAYGRNPFVYQASILPGAQMPPPASILLGKAKSSMAHPRLSSQARRLALASAVIANLTGRPVFCWTIERPLWSCNQGADLELHDVVAS